MGQFDHLPTLADQRRCAPPKPERGSSRLERERDDAKRLQDERTVASLVKARDGYRCRWPEEHKCRGPLEAVHIVDKSLGGATDTSNVVCLCRWLHRQGPESVHGKQLKIEKETERGANAGLSFWRRGDTFDALGQPIYYCVGREVRPFQLERI